MKTIEKEKLKKLRKFEKKIRRNKLFFFLN